MSEEMKYDLSGVHAVNLKLLKEIDRICRKYKIKYALDSGTLLGAIRHGGFIPWDDDVDVVFTRANYEMFKKVARRELPEGMSFVEPDEYHGGKAFYDFVSRVTYDKSQKFEDSGKMAFYDDKITRLNVDLFILDPLPDKAIPKKITKLLHCVVYGLALGHRWKIELSDYKGIMKLFVAVLSTVGRLIPFPVIYKLWKALCAKDKNKNTGLYFYTNYAPDYFYVEMKKEWDDTVEEISNLSSVFHCCKLAVPGMVKKQSGRIVNISSVWGVCGASCEAAYSASKGGVGALTQALAKELAPSGIQVNAIACGAIDTEMNGFLSAEEEEALLDEIPAGRMGRPEEVADVVFAMTGSPDYLTGQILRLDGGWI